MSCSNFGSPWVLALLAGGVALACKGGAEAGAEIGPICPGCVAGGESSDFSGGRDLSPEERCDMTFVVSEPLEAAGTADDMRLANEVRRHVSASESASFLWSPNEVVESGTPANGYDPGVISVRTTFEWGETFVERLDPARCADGYCFDQHRGLLTRCSWREERWLRQEVELHVQTSDSALAVTLTGSGRITLDGWFGGQLRANVSEATGTLRIAPSKAGDPHIDASLVFNGSKVAGRVQLSHWPWSDTDPYFPPYSPISGQWPAAESTIKSNCGAGTISASVNAAQDLLGGKSPADLVTAVRAATALPQSASWDTEGSELVKVTYHETADATACVSRYNVWFPEQQVRATSSETDIDVTWKGLNVTHEAGNVVGFSSDAQFPYEDERIGERIEDPSELTGDKASVSVEISVARTNVDSGYGTWIETAFPDWDLSITRYRPAACPGDLCGYDETVACLGTDELGYNACHTTPEQLPTKSVDLSDEVSRIITNQSQVTPGVPTSIIPPVTSPVPSPNNSTAATPTATQPDSTAPNDTEPDALSSAVIADQPDAGTSADAARSHQGQSATIAAAAAP